MRSTSIDEYVVPIFRVGVYWYICVTSVVSESDRSTIAGGDDGGVIGDDGGDPDKIMSSGDGGDVSGRTGFRTNVVPCSVWRSLSHLIYACCTQWRQWIVAVPTDTSVNSVIFCDV